MKTKLFLPQNFYANLFLTELNPDHDIEVIYLPAALISKKIAEDENSIGIIPTLDLLTFKDLFVSSRIGISFNALLSNSYLFFNEDHETIDEISLVGDVTANEIILSKILFREFYDLDINPKLITDDSTLIQKSLIVVGDKNFQDEIFINGLSFSEEIIEMINAPYINFALAGSSEKLLNSFVTQHENKFVDGHEESLTKTETGFPELSKDFIAVNIQHVVFDFENQDLEGIKTLLQMPYYHGIVKELIDLKFV